jgi:ribosomal protein S12 methylthiotransferase
MSALEGEGFGFIDNPEHAGVIVVNTCGFIDPAKEESIETILEASTLKSEKREVILVVLGCLVERYKNDLKHLLPEVDIFLDLKEEERIGKVLKERLGLRSEMEYVFCERTRPRLTPKHVSFLKVAEGCSRHCTFCTIPTIRGAYRSRGVDDLLDEAGRLESAGVKELNIISQDTVSYLDDNGYGLVQLLEKLLAETKIPWFRLLYMNPSGFDDSLVDLLCREERLLGYVDIPVQHASDQILKRMGRQSTRKDIERLISKLRDRMPGVILRTTVMVGFPGEAEKHFRHLLDFIEEIKFDRLGVFSYSREEGTPASLLDGQVADEIIQERSALVQELQRTISRMKGKERNGELTTVLVDADIGDGDVEISGDVAISEWEGTTHIGRSRCEAYDVDGLIYLSGAFTVGELCRAKIVDSGDYDLFAVRI